MAIDIAQDYKSTCFGMRGGRNMIPFWMWPGSWGLKGKTRAIAQAEYELVGYDFECKVAEINYSEDHEQLALALLAAQLKYCKIDQYTHDMRVAEVKFSDPDQLELEKLDIDLAHKKISEYDYDIASAIKTCSGTELELARLDIDLEHGKITEQAYERRKADIQGEPWVAMPKISWDPENPGKTYFELDYNEHFVGFLRSNGYLGTDDDCINKWLNDVCYSVLEEMSQPELEIVNTIRKIRLPDGKTEHS